MVIITIEKSQPTNESIAIKIYKYTQEKTLQGVYSSIIKSSIMLIDTPSEEELLDGIKIKSDMHDEELAAISYTIEKIEGSICKLTANFESNIKFLPLKSLSDKKYQLLLYTRNDTINSFANRVQYLELDQIKHDDCSFVSPDKKEYYLPSHHSISFGQHLCFPPVLTDYTLNLISDRSEVTSRYNSKNYIAYLKKIAEQFYSFYGEDANFYSLVSGIDSFIPDLILGEKSSPIHYCKPNPQGLLQESIVRLFYAMNKRPLEICEYKDSVRIMESRWNQIKEGIKADPLVKDKQSMSNRLNLLRTDITLGYKCIEITSKRIHSRKGGIILIRGNMISPYMSFNGTLQRDFPVIIGHLRGALRRTLIGKSAIRIYYIILRILYKQEESIARLYLILAKNPLVRKNIFELRLPDYSYFYRKMDIYSTSVMDAYHYARQIKPYEGQNRIKQSLLIAMIVRLNGYMREIRRDYMYFPKNVRTTDLASTSTGLINQSVELIPWWDIVSPKSKIYNVLKMITGVPFRRYVLGAIQTLPPERKKYVYKYIGYKQFLTRIRQLGRH